MADSWEDLENPEVVRLEPEEREAEEIQDQTQKIRDRLPEAVVDLKFETERLLDWRHYVRQHPALVLGTAAAVGYWLVPKRRRSHPPAVPPAEATQASVGQIGNLLRGKTAPASTAPPVEGPTILNTVLAAAGGIALRLALSFVGDQVTQAVSTFAQSSREKRTETEGSNHAGVHPLG